MRRLTVQRLAAVDGRRLGSAAVNHPTFLPSVCVLLRPGHAALDAAVARQSVTADTTVRIEGTLAAGLRRAAATGAEWIWLLDGASLPAPTALAALLASLERIQGIPAPALLASAVHGGDGGLDPHRASWYRRQPTEVAMAAAERQLLPIRATAGPLLVHRRVIEQGPLPRAKLTALGETLEWTARVLRSEAGYLVPDSQSILSPGARSPGRDRRAALALVLGGAFVGTDRLRVALELIERAGSGSR
jgi:hypothetical protein